MAQVNMSLRIDAELKDAFMAAAKSMDRNGSQLIRDFMRQTVERQHNTWFRDQVEAGRQQLERGDMLSHDMVESFAAAWRDEMSRKVAGK
ncbi:type II toxin-antitoxin system antitoxin YacA [Escherichia coli O120:H1]|uniref:type II toxin-antitoxin system antitoxin YacA n=1 Tax=Escherichia coli TaxID=562 RepID=UPI000BE1BCA6|nr:type II toxin-antitoxin system antitoxin YacA [Escherichia coli]CAD5778823.1 YacA [Escherichia coli]CAD5794104.1 YacA [Escherichia coli]